MRNPDLIATILSRRKLTLTGLLLIVTVFFGYSFWLQSDLPAQMPTIIGQRLRDELTTEAATRFLHVSEVNRQATAEERKQFEEVRQAIEALQITSLKKRGWGSIVVVKATFHVDSQWLAEEPDTRYYRLQFSWINGWRLPYRVDKGRYQSALFYFRY
jgi:hypothetical protein